MQMPPTWGQQGRSIGRRQGPSPQLYWSQMVSWQQMAPEACWHPCSGRTESEWSEALNVQDLGTLMSSESEGSGLGLA